MWRGDYERLGYGDFVTNVRSDTLSTTLILVHNVLAGKSWMVYQLTVRTVMSLQILWNHQSKTFDPLSAR